MPSESDIQTEADASVYTDESHAYEHLSETGRSHSCVNHSQGEWARDDDGDGVYTATP
jgi:hypothetical protein